MIAKIIFDFIFPLGITSLLITTFKEGNDSILVQKSGIDAEILIALTGIILACYFVYWARKKGILVSKNDHEKIME